MSGKPDLERQLAALKSQSEPASPGDIAAIVESVMASLSGDLSAAELKLYAELEAVARLIHNARSEIAAVMPADISAEHIPLATDELDAVVGATEEATGAILDAAEALSSLAGTLPPEPAAAITAAVTRIFEACNFQDITGQRIAKVVRTLKHIEDRVGVMLGAFGGSVGATAATAAVPEPRPEPRPDGPPSESDLLSGPQLPQDAPNQAEIDAILARFDR
jgi:chemotaxis protein CheZ